jgi:hypothetical protein
MITFSFSTFFLDNNDHASKAKNNTLVFFEKIENNKNNETIN